MIYLGIDPGLTGAIAVVTKGKTFKRTGVYDTPITETKKGKRKKKEYLPLEMAKRLYEYSPAAGIFECHVFIEKVHSMPKQGVASSFNFGVGYGLWLGILAALEIPYTEVTPQAWKKNIMQGIRDKDAARIRAQQLYPGLVRQLSRKKDIGRADALLIAEYGRRCHG